MRTIDNQVLAALHQIRDAIKNKECCGGGSSDSSSKEITIDDVVKFIHNNLVGSPIEAIFPYTTWDSIPNYDDAENNQMCKSSGEGAFKPFILRTSSYTIGIKHEYS